MYVAYYCKPGIGKFFYYDETQKIEHARYTALFERALGPVAESGVIEYGGYRHPIDGRGKWINPSREWLNECEENRKEWLNKCEENQNRRGKNAPKSEAD